MSEFTPLPGEYNSTAPEFTPPAEEFRQSVRTAAGEKNSSSRKALRRLLLAGAAVLSGWVLLTAPPKAAAPQPTAPPVVTPAPAPDHTPSPSPVPTPSPTPMPSPSPVGNRPVIEADFFCFSHDHRGRVRIVYPGAVHSVRVQVRETVLDLPVYEYYLTEEDVESGVFELPMLSTGDLFMDHYDEYNAVGSWSWPEFELTVDVWYGNEDGSGEERYSIVREPDFELGYGFSYMQSDAVWSEYIPPDSFYVTPWEDMEEIRYVINDPDAVTDPLTLSVDVSFGGRHASADEFETVISRSEYTLVNTETGEETPTVSFNKLLVLRRPDWIPQEGTVHVVLVQQLACTGEQWVREFDFSYPVNYD